MLQFSLEIREKLHPLKNEKEKEKNARDHLPAFLFFHLLFAPALSQLYTPRTSKWDRMHQTPTHKTQNQQNTYAV